jgi:hypothetical protein
MTKKFTLLVSAFLAFNFLANATFETVPVTGYNSDVVANGVGSATTSTTANADGGTPGFAFLTQDFRALAGNAAPTYYLPQTGLINSANTAGVSFQLDNYSGNNALRLTATNSGTVTFVTPKYASDVYVLATSGTGISTATFTVTFLDGSSQVFTGVSIADWYGGSGFAAQGIGRVALSNDAQDGVATNPRLYELKLSITAANYSKQIASITVAKTNTTLGVTVIVMAISINSLPGCASPVAQPSGLNLTPTLYNISGSFTAAAPTPDKYLVLRTPGATAPSVAPINGTLYTAGGTLGNATIVSTAAATTFNDVSVVGSTTYTYTIYSYNDVLCYNPAYNTTSPLAATASTPACNPVAAGNYSVGPTGTYATITAALTVLYNAGGATGNVNLELQNTYTSGGETFPITIPNVSTGPCAVGTPIVKIRPATGASGLTITSANTTATIDFNNSKNVIIDGRPGGVGSTVDLTIENTATAGVAIRLINESSSNTVSYCNVTGQNTSGTSSALSGVVYIGGTTGTEGNDNNTISYNNIHATAGGFPAIAISAYNGTSVVNANNDGNIISNNNIYDFFHAASASTAIKVDVGNTAWTISDNNIYQTATRTYTTGATHRALWITPNVGSLTTSANNFSITNNFIGGSLPAAGGTPYTMTGTIATLFMGMDLSLGGGIASSVQGNVIRNIALTSSSTTTSGVFIGIGTANGIINIGTVAGNIIGAATGTGSIVVTNGSGGTTFGIRLGSGTTMTVANNTVGSFTINGSSASIPTNFIGIGTGITNGGATTATITGNLVGSLTTANSINLATPYTSTLSQSFTGINITNGVTTSTISNNTIANINNAHAAGGTASFTRGIAVTTSASSITSNTVRNLSTATLATAGGATSGVSGIVMTSSNAAGCNVVGNTVHSLSLSAASSTAASNMTGIFYSGISTAVSNISKNFVHSFDLAAANTNVTMTGLDFATATANITNNIFRLGVKSDGTDLSTAMVVRGISSNSSTATNNIWFNSIYVGGTGVGSTAKNTFAFTRTSTSGTYDIRNNIFVNNRSNAVAGGGKHYALYFTTAITGVTSNYNLYQASGTDGYMGYTGTTDNLNYNSGWISGDDNSRSGDPKFINATGAVSVVDLHITTGVASPAEGGGIDIPAITDDFDGDIRANLTPTDIGADAGNFAGILPVSILSFKGEKTVAGNKLEWKTATEFNSNGFEIERSADGINFSKITFINTKAVNGNSSVQLDYQLTDTKARATSTNYYRLKQIDKNNKAVYSGIVLIKGDKANALTITGIYPNPAVERLSVSVSSPVGGTVSLVVNDLSGKMIMQKDVHLIAGSNTIVLPVVSLTAGTYFLQVIGSDKAIKGTVKFIK